VLGFVGRFLPNGYVDLAGTRVTDGSHLVTRMDAKLGKDVKKLVTPRVLEKAREYFGRPTLDGVELEDQGGSGTPGSHGRSE